MIERKPLPVLPCLKIEDLDQPPQMMQFREQRSLKKINMFFLALRHQEKTYLV